MQQHRQRFQSTLPRGERRGAVQKIYQSHGISIHAPARGATGAAEMTKAIREFQSTLPRGERRRAGGQSHHPAGISIHAPARGATFCMRSHETGKRDFNPRSREGSDIVHSISPPVILISIHAPARGATLLLVSAASVRYMISIHAPARGATRFAHIKSTGCDYFNPRSREGSDNFLSMLEQVLNISIHAPARGATSILSKIHPMFLTISHNASSFSSFPFHSFLPHLLNSSTFCALFQVRISRAFSVYYRFAPKKSTPDLQLYHVLHRYVQL